MTQLKIKIENFETTNKKVKIKGKIISEINKGKEIKTEISILQLAKIWETDKEVLKELRKTWFGSKELESKCLQTQKLIKKFPKIPTRNNEVSFDYTSVKDNIINTDSQGKKEELVKIFAEDLNGWEGEGIIITLRKETYKKYFQNKKELWLKMSPDTIKIGVTNNTKS